MNQDSTPAEGSRVVLVTGGNRGIGLACAQAFAAQGHQVAVTCRGEVPPEVTDAGLLAVRCDITDTEQINAAFAEIEEKLGPVSPETVWCCACPTTSFLQLLTPT